MAQPTITPTAPAAPQAGPVRSKSAQKRRNRYVIAPLVLIGVNVVLFLVFFVWPGALGMLYSFTDYRGIGKLHFIGLANFQKLFADGSVLRRLGPEPSCTRSCRCRWSTSAPSASPRCWSARPSADAPRPRPVIFLPWLISPIVAGVIWRWMFGENFGFVNFVIPASAATAAVASDANLALVVVIVAAAWGGTAFNMLLFIAALKNVPKSLLEAAELDGANAWQRFRHDHPAGHRADVVHRDPAVHPRRHEGVRDDPGAERRRPRHRRTT